MDGDVVNIKFLPFPEDYKGVFITFKGKALTDAYEELFFDLPRKCGRNDRNLKRNLNAYNVLKQGDLKTR
ncbi:hypothetical protein KCP75_00565 [Salmonella enterica subsp. enterica]|nr:hypothetical protein KCP75_00565 [Salmonella enterica subsp. enterica]